MAWSRLQVRSGIDASQTRSARGFPGPSVWSPDEIAGSTTASAPPSVRRTTTGPPGVAEPLDTPLGVDNPPEECAIVGSDGGLTVRCSVACS